MDNFLTIDNMEKIRTLGFIHEDLKVISYNVVSYTEDNITYVADLDDNILIKAKLDFIKIYGTFVVVTESKHLSSFMSDCDVLVYNVLTFNEVKPLAICITGTEDICALGNEFIAIRYRTVKSDWRTYTQIIYNKYMEKIFDMRECSTGRGRAYIEDTPIKSKVRYTLSGHWKTMILNKAKASIDIFDTIDFDIVNGIQLVGTEWSKKDNLAINTNTVENIRYKLSVFGRVVGKSYQDITKPQELHNTNYFIVYDLIENRTCKGLIDKEGRELIQPIYDDIKYIGENVFILTYLGSAIVFSLIKGLMLDNIKSNNIWIHPTLPLTVVTRESDYWIIDCYGRLYNLVEITKNFECYSTDKDKDVLKINTGYKNVYVSNTLVPITNIHTIKILNTYDWVRI